MCVLMDAVLGVDVCLDAVLAADVCLDAVLAADVCLDACTAVHASSRCGEEVQQRLKCQRDWSSCDADPGQASAGNEG